MLICDSKEYDALCSKKFLIPLNNVFSLLENVLIRGLRQSLALDLQPFLALADS